MRNTIIISLLILIIFPQPTFSVRVPTDWGLGFQIQGANSIFLGEPQDYIPNYLNWGFNYELSYKSISINGYMLVSWDSKTNDIITISPEIPKDYNTALTNVGFYAGYKIIDNSFVRICPNIGMAFTDIYPEDNEIINDIRLHIKPTLSFGVNIDFKLFGIKSDRCNSGFDYTYFRTRLAINQADFIDLYNGYMINFEIALGGFWSIKKRGYKK